MTTPIFTYKIRLRKDDFWEHGYDWQEIGDMNSHPLIVLRQEGTVRAGWPWNRYDQPKWYGVLSAKNMEDAAEVIKKDAAAQLKKFKNKSLADQVRANFTAPVYVDVQFENDEPKIFPSSNLF